MKFFAITVLVLLFVTLIASLEGNYILIVLFICLIKSALIFTLHCAASGMTLSAEQPESKIDRVSWII